MAKAKYMNFDIRNNFRNLWNRSFRGKDRSGYLKNLLKIYLELSRMIKNKESISFLRRRNEFEKENVNLKIDTKCTIVSFAKNLVNEVVLKAINILNADKEKGKSWKNKLESMSQNLSMEKNQDDLESRENYSQENRPIVQMIQMQLQDGGCVDPTEREQIIKLVQDLGNLQIGDSSLVKPGLTTLENQIKRAVHNIDNMIVTESKISEGQGDVDHQQLIETIEITEITDDEDQSNIEAGESTSRLDTAKVTSCVLYKMIEELETESNPEVASMKSIETILINSPNGEKIAKWEESEEKFIRIIEGSQDDEEQDKSDTEVSFMKFNERPSSKTESVSSLAKDVKQEVVDAPPAISMIFNDFTAKSDSAKKLESISLEANSKLKSKKKRSLGSKLRRFFLSTLGRKSDS